MESDTVKIAFTAYLATFGGAPVGTAANVAAEGLARKAGTSVEWETLARMSAASCLGDHDRRVGNPPRALAEVTREVERMLAPEPAPNDASCPENRAPRQGDTWRHMPTLTTWKVLSVLTPGDGPGVYACEGRSHDAAPPSPKRQDILIDTESTAWRLVGAGEP